jgi:formylglycine-generating enzyme required for sulfatase activity
VPEGKANHPVTDITRYEASACAPFRGKQLPTASQWEGAARNDADGERAIAYLYLPNNFSRPLTVIN